MKVAVLKILIIPVMNYFRSLLFIEDFYRRFGGVFEWDAIFLAVVKNSVAREVNLAVLQL